MIIVISSPEAVINEHQIIHQLFEEGMDQFHIYKPHFTNEQTEDFVQQIFPQYHSRISLHAQYFKFHSLTQLEACRQKYDYAFLSPVFDSISKAGYKSPYDLNELK